MYNIKKNAFTLVELIIVVGVIGILMMATTVYLSGTDEKRKIIEAQGCANTIGGELNNFVFYALTSKVLKDNNTPISLSHYIVQLTGCNASGYCDKIDLSYDTENNSDPTIYKTVSISACQQTKQPLTFNWSGDNNNNKKIMMNKGFAPKSETNRNVFYISNNNGNTIELSGDIITATCFDKDCKSKKEIGKFRIDARSQTISRKNCKFYDDDPTKCKERES